MPQIVTTLTRLERSLPTRNDSSLHSDGLKC